METEADIFYSVTGPSDEAIIARERGKHEAIQARLQATIDELLEEREQRAQEVEERAAAGLELASAGLERISELEV